MKQKKDRSMLYAALAGFALFMACMALLLLPFEASPIIYIYDLPEGTQYTLWEPPRNWMGDGVTTLTAQIPSEAAADFEKTLLEKGYTGGAVPEDIQESVRGGDSTDIIPDMENGLWWFQNDSHDETNPFTNYTFCFYDPETCTYYYIEYDS